eukprot:991211_1
MSPRSRAHNASSLGDRPRSQSIHLRDSRKVPTHSHTRSRSHSISEHADQKSPDQMVAEKVIHLSIDALFEGTELSEQQCQTLEHLFKLAHGRAAFAAVLNSRRQSGGAGTGLRIPEGSFDTLARIVRVFLDSALAELQGEEESDAKSLLVSTIRPCKIVLIMSQSFYHSQIQLHSPKLKSTSQINRTVNTDPIVHVADPRCSNISGSADILSHPSVLSQASITSNSGPVNRTESDMALNASQPPDSSINRTESSTQSSHKSKLSLQNSTITQSESAKKSTSTAMGQPDLTPKESVTDLPLELPLVSQSVNVTESTSTDTTLDFGSRNSDSADNPNSAKTAAVPVTETSKEARKQFLQELIQSHPLWQHPRFWDESFWDSYLMEMNEHRQVKSWLAKTEVADIERARDNILFSQLAAWTHNMAQFHVPSDRVMRFVTKITSAHTLPQDMVDTLMDMHVSGDKCESTAKHAPESTESQCTNDSTQSQHIDKSTQSHHALDSTQSHHALGATKSQGMDASAQSQHVSGSAKNQSVDDSSERQPGHSIDKNRQVCADSGISDISDGMGQLGDTVEIRTDNSINVLEVSDVFVQ